MRELLEKWADSGDTATQVFGEGPLAPVIQHRRCYLHTEGETDGYCVVHGGNWHGWRVNPDRPVDHAHILAATIEAIEAQRTSRGRGWTWTIRSPRNGEPQHVGIVYYANRKWKAGLGDTPAEALLTAYLAAIEAEGAS